jgi:hypothetical protein
VRIHLWAVAVLFWLPAISGHCAAGAPTTSGHEWQVEQSGPIKLRFTLPADRSPRAEPLLSVGQGGRGDIVFIYYQPGNRVSLGWEQAGGEVLLSEPQEVPADGVCEIVISLGSLMPSEQDFYQRNPELTPLRGAAVVQFTGRTVLSARGVFAPGATKRVVAGANVVGGAMATAYFQGRLEEVTTVEPGKVLSASGTEELASYPGPIRIRLRFPQGRAGYGEPLVVTGATGAGDIVYVRYESERRLRIGFDHWNKGGPVSRRIEYDPGTAHELMLSLGSLLPSTGPGDDAFAPLRRRCSILLDDKPVLVCESEFYPATPAQIFVGENPIGGSTTSPAFAGQIVSVESVKPEQWTAFMPPLADRQ